MLTLAQQLIIERYKNPLSAGSLSEPDYIGEGSNPFCGDEVRIEITFDDDQQVKELKHSCRACTICTVAADFLAEEARGKSMAEIMAIQKEEITNFLAIPLSPTRLKCALLPLEILQKTLKSNS